MSSIAALISVIICLVFKSIWFIAPDCKHLHKFHILFIMRSCTDSFPPAQFETNVMFYNIHGFSSNVSFSDAIRSLTHYVATIYMMFYIPLCMKENFDEEELMKKRTFVLGSPYRVDVVRALNGDKFKIPSHIARESTASANHISKILGEMKAKEVVVCINEEARKGRLYRLTPIGEAVAKDLEESGLL